jgi:hypothetical protein
VIRAPPNFPSEEDGVWQKLWHLKVNEVNKGRERRFNPTKATFDCLSLAPIFTAFLFELRPNANKSGIDRKCIQTRRYANGMLQPCHFPLTLVGFSFPTADLCGFC